MAAAEQDERVRRRALNELILPRGEYAYTRDTTSGVTATKTGPTVVNMQGSEEPVLFDERAGRFRAVELQDAAQVNTVVPTGHYAVLANPSQDGKFPEAGSKNTNQELRIGERVHIPGPANFALWPRQAVQVIEGHQLRSNQYLIVRVYDEDAARASWSSAIVKPVGEEEAITPETIPEGFTVGRLSIIKGTEVSFYIPPTGVEVMVDLSTESNRGNYVREALTMERLQYCILVDESGNKRYVRGPDVIFPKPTERFYENNKGERLFRPVELNGPIQGLHVKVIDGYTDHSGDHGPSDEVYIEGDELFITGETTPIYFPCELHSAIKYDGKTKHFATAIPAGDGRYVLNRHTGVIRMVRGGEEGTMSLPDPRIEVFVRRVLSDAESLAMYPYNVEALQFNQALRAIQAKAPTTRKGAVSEGDLRRGMKSRGMVNVGEAQVAYAASAAFADVSHAGRHTMAEMGGDEFSRAATYTEPRTVTIGNDKFQGVIKINPFTGYAVMVVDPAGNRRVVHGPQRVLLGFSETLETLALSTGKPKNTDNLLTTAYLQVKHNKIGDVFEVTTGDHVTVLIKLSLRVDFEGDEMKWFSVSNYVKLLCDHVRSKAKAAVRKLSIEDFHQNSEDTIRNIVLGDKDEDGERPGLEFSENGMVVYDVEVLDVRIKDSKIQGLLQGAQHEAVQASIELARNARRLDAVQRQQVLVQQELESKAETAEVQNKLMIQNIARQLSQAMAHIQAEVAKSEATLESQMHDDAVLEAAATAENARNKAAADTSLAIYQNKENVRIASLQEEAQAHIEQLKAVMPGFSEALLALNSADTMVKIAEAMSVQKLLGGQNVPDILVKLFEGTPLAGLTEKMIERAATSPRNGSSASA